MKERIKNGIVIIIIVAVATGIGVLVAVEKINNSASSMFASVSNSASKSCYGVIPSNSNLCYGDSTNLTVGTMRTLIPGCTTLRKCEYTCKSGYVFSELGTCEVFNSTGNSDLF